MLNLQARDSDLPKEVIDVLVAVRRSFLGKLSGRLDEILDAFADGNTQKCLMICHELKGSAGNFYFTEISRTFADLELLLKNNVDPSGDVNLLLTKIRGSATATDPAAIDVDTLKYFVGS